MTSGEYETKWEAFSWELSEAAQSFFALLACSEWQEALMSRVKNGPPLQSSPHSHAISIFSNSIIAHFFISICRIREPTKTKLSLPILFADAQTTRSVDPALKSSIQALLDRTKGPFIQIKKVRGMTVAHLERPGNPFAVLKKEKITNAMVRSYLEDCAELYSLLGKPIGRDYSAGLARYQPSQIAVRKALDLLFPL